MTKIRKFVLPNLIVAMLVVVSVLLSKLFTLGIIDTKGAANASLGGQTAFLVSIDSFEKVEDAEKFSVKVSSVGGAGYVMFNNKKHHVIASLYLSKAEATAVSENLKGQYANISILELGISKKNINNKELANDVNLLINDVINFYVTNSVKLDKNEITENNVLLKSLPLNVTIDDLIIRLETDASENSIKLRKLLKAIKNNLQLLSNFISTGSTFKYMCINTYMDIFTAFENL